MYAKTGLSFLAAAGVAVGVVGMTMGGASGSSVSCAPGHGGANGSGSDVSRSSSDRDAANANGASDVNGASTTAPTTATPVDPAGSDGTPTDPNGNGSGSGNNGSGTTIVVHADTPGDGSGGGSGSGSSGDRPLLHVTEHTSATNAAGVSVPPTGTSIIGRSNLLEGLHISAHVNQR